jgi:hypothetical protein
VLFTEDRSQAVLVLTAPPSTEGYKKPQMLAELGHEHFAGAGGVSQRSPAAAGGGKIVSTQKCPSGAIPAAAYWGKTTRDVGRRSCP